MKPTTTDQPTYIAYYRKSTESDERQVQSIPDQRAWTKRFVTEQGLKVCSHHEESFSARKPGRPVFEEVLAAVEAGKANALIAYDPSRLSRNTMDGARIVELLDSGKLVTIVTANGTYKNTTNDKFMLAFFFAESKRYTDALAEVVKRGVDSKLAKGSYPGKAKLGYLNHPKTGEIIPDPDKFPLVQEMFAEYATNKFAMTHLAKMMFARGLRSYRGKLFPKAVLAKILTDPFYYGAFTWKGELFAGVHEPAIPKELWDKVQRVYRSRSKAQAKFKHDFPFLGLLRCGECGGAITAEEKERTQQNGNYHKWRYYRCTKKSGKMKCSQPFIREEALAQEMAGRLQEIVIPEEWAIPMLAQVDTWQLKETSRESGQMASMESELEEIAARLRRLNELYVDADVDRAEYAARKRAFVNQKLSLEAGIEKIARQGAMAWLEPLRACLNAVRERGLPTAGGDLMELRDFVAEVGSNLTLNSRKVLWDWDSSYALLAERGPSSEWSGRRESNPPSQLGRLEHYHYATPAG